MNTLRCYAGVNFAGHLFKVFEHCFPELRVMRQTLDTIQIDHELDTRDLMCPMPILVTKKKLAQMSRGEILRIRSADHSSMQAFRGYAKQTGNKLLFQEEDGDEFITVIRRN